MLDFFSGILHKIGITVGAVFISLGVGVGGQVPQPIVQTEPSPVTEQATPTHTTPAAIPTTIKKATPTIEQAPAPSTAPAGATTPVTAVVAPAPVSKQATPKTSQTTSTQSSSQTNTSTGSTPQSTPTPSAPAPTLTATKGEANYTRTVVDDTHQRADFTIQAVLTAHDGTFYIPKSSLVGGPISDASASTFLLSSFACPGDGTYCIISGAGTITMTGSVTGPQGNYHSEFGSLQYGTSPNGPFAKMDLQYKTASLTVLSSD